MDDDFERMTMREFNAALASSSPTPGGGTVAAIALSQAAALTCMVCDLTIDNEKWKDGWADADIAHAKAVPLVSIAMDLARDDSVAFDAVMAAFRMPRDGDEEMDERREAIRSATLEAAMIPLKTAQAAIELLRVLPGLAEHGNGNATSDVGVAALLAHAACSGALMNVDINLNSLADDRGSDAAEQAQSVRSALPSDLRAALEQVNARLH